MCEYLVSEVVVDSDLSVGMAFKYEGSVPGRLASMKDSVGGFTRMSSKPSPSHHLQSRVMSPAVFLPTPDRLAAYELSVHDLNYKVRLTIMVDDSKNFVLYAFKLLSCDDSEEAIACQVMFGTLFR